MDMVAVTPFVLLALGFLCGLSPQATFCRIKAACINARDSTRDAQGIDRLLRHVTKSHLYLGIILLFVGLIDNNITLVIVFVGLFLTILPAIVNQYPHYILTELLHIGVVITGMYVLVYFQVSGGMDQANISILPSSLYVFVGTASVAFVMIAANLGSWGYLFQLSLVIGFLFYFGIDKMGAAIYPVMFFLGSLISSYGKSLEQTDTVIIPKSSLAYQGVFVVTILGGVLLGMV